MIDKLDADLDAQEWSAAALTARLANYLVNAYTDGRGYDPADPDDVAVTLKDGFDIVLAEMRRDQRAAGNGDLYPESL